MISAVAVFAAFAFVMPSTINGAFPDKVQDCSRCHGPDQGTYFEDILSISVSKTVLQPGEVYSVGIDIVIQTGLSKKETGYAIEDLGTSTWPVWLDATAVQSHYDQAMTAPNTPGVYSYRVWGESGPATSDGKTDFDDYTITVEQAPPANGPPTIAQLANLNGAARMAVNFSASATDPDLDVMTYIWNFGDGTGLVVGSSVSHIYMAAGSYTFSVSVDDAHGHNVTASASANITGPFVINLVTGWNFVSLPLVGYGYKASTLGLNTGDTVTRWNPTTVMYQNYIIGVPVNDFTIDPSTGYWINVPSGTRTLTLYGAVPDTVQTRTITLPAGGGWAIIGFASLKTTMHARDIPSMYSVAGSITTVATWNPVTKAYTSWISVIPAVNNFALVPGQAYWILCGASGTLTYIP
jgi:PKD repeat protein